MLIKGASSSNPINVLDNIMGEMDRDNGPPEPPKNNRAKKDRINPSVSLNNHPNMSGDMDGIDISVPPINVPSSELINNDCTYSDVVQIHSRIQLKLECIVPMVHYHHHSKMREEKVELSIEEEEELMIWMME